jgi:type IV secretion system protein VirB8
MQEMIKTGEYYKEAIKWYNSIFILPITLRSVLAILIFIFAMLSTTLLLNVVSILPLSKQLKYKIDISDDAQMKANITAINSTDSSLQETIARILINDYVVNRETYDYAKLLQQYEYVRNTSSSTEYQNFENSMSLDNLNSLILKYQKTTQRNIQISSITFQGGYAVINFIATASDNNGSILENASWKVILQYDIDNLTTSSTGDFNFLVTSYKTEMLQDLRMK